MNQKKIVGLALLVGLALFIIALAISYNPDLQQTLYTITGSLWLIFGTWAAILLLKDKN